MMGGLVEEGLQVTLAFEQGPVFAAANRQELIPTLRALAIFDGSRGAGAETLLAQLPPAAGRSPEVWAVTTVAGWKRGGRPRGVARVVLIDQRAVDGGGALPGNVACVPLVDPEHRRLLQAWKEVTAHGEALV